jgi:hypothetical protein
MVSQGRRRFFYQSTKAFSIPFISIPFPLFAGCNATGDRLENPRSTTESELWIEGAREQIRKNPTKDIEGLLQLARFLDPVYVLTASTKWKAKYSDLKQYQEVIVPRGFVTDLASIPRIFFTALRPDGVYCHAAIIHDYLYWEQKRPREEADDIFEAAMKDTNVPSIQLIPIINMVRAFGKSAWEKNMSLRLQGEKRILKEFPKNATTLWTDWKKNSNVFL